MLCKQTRRRPPSHIPNQPIYSGWNNRNHVNINIDNLTQLKIPTIESPAEELDDIGLDGVTNDYENGCIEESFSKYGGGYIFYKYSQNKFFPTQRET